MYAVHNLLCFVEEKPLATFHNLFPVTELMTCDLKLSFVLVNDLFCVLLLIIKH